MTARLILATLLGVLVGYGVSEWLREPPPIKISRQPTYHGELAPTVLVTASAPPEPLAPRHWLVVQRAEVDPAIGDDASRGYAIGVLWGNTLTGTVFEAVDVSPDAAVWKRRVDMRMSKDGTIDILDAWPHAMTDVATPEPGRRNIGYPSPAPHAHTASKGKP